MKSRSVEIQPGDEDSTASGECVPASPTLKTTLKTKKYIIATVMWKIGLILSLTGILYSTIQGIIFGVGDILLGIGLALFFIGIFWETKIINQYVENESMRLKEAFYQATKFTIEDVRIILRTLAEMPEDDVRRLIDIYKKTNGGIK